MAKQNSAGLLSESVPGTILTITEEGFVCNTGNGYVEITEVQPAERQK
jgi:methionyl-tRNA formyltransferase